ncbi:AAA family ATPase [Cordyceps fumosorosea ARSEF 2679]|uniref:AAA family ATPase n=1 Tax=Cordyceps fumosorosea (strain ARSEF 2679) TaxID=1081104 RepID=A0A168EK98_CORFA|nr:AAA family ATPase [Cordyceps fumosorosea ARSEF 2679]OAA73916.1 AAA family ATPase [Cordyceps fumosorosea ARSEF 2679]
MVSKRKRVLEDFDPNKSDSEDENFDPTEQRAHKSSKKARSTGSRSGKKRSRRYGGSDIDDDEDELSDSQEGSFIDDDEDEDENAPINAAGRRTRKVAVKPQNYAESEGSEEEEARLSDESKEEIADEAQDQKATRSSSRVVKLKVPSSALSDIPRRATRATSHDQEDLVELSNSGRHAVASRGSMSRSPEPVTRRSSRASKGVKTAPETIEEATQESSPKVTGLDDEDLDDLDKDILDLQKNKEKTEEMEDVEKHENPEVTGTGDDDDDDDIPTSRRTRASRSGAVAEAEEEDQDATSRPSRRLTRKSSARKSTQEPSSDFEPGDDSEDAASDMGKDGADDQLDSPTPRARGGRQSRSAGASRQDSGDEDAELDLDELNEEARELRKSSRPRRRRESTPIAYQENTRRSRARVNYYMPPLTSANIEDDGEDQAPTPARRRRGAASAVWDRNLNTTFGPFGGGGAVGSLLNGPWGTGATGGVDSDSSDDEMVHRSSIAGNVGMTPTSAPPGGLLPGLQGMNADGGAPNVGKIKDRKALADADPLGVDMNVDFSKVGGLQGHIDQLKEMVQLPLLYPELFTRFHVTPPRGVLFHGPPGTGKTLLARALANSAGHGGRKISFYMRKGADALSKWVGEAEKQLRLLFEEARKTQPSIIFFDEIDGLAPVRSSKQEQIHASIVSTLLALMDGMDGRGQVIVIGATNRPDNIDPALRRPGRFDREFYFPLPDIDGRRSILDIHTKDWGLAEDFKASLADKTKGYGGADLRALCTEAALNAIQRTYPQIYASQEKLLVDPSKINVHASDFMLSIKKLIPSSERSATSGASPLPATIQPLLQNQFDNIKRALDLVMPRRKKTTALEEAMYEPYADDDNGFKRETLHQDFERTRVFRPRLLVHGSPGMGQNYIAAGILHYLEGVHVQNFDLPSLLADGRSMEQVIVGLFTEVRRHKPSVIYIPNIDVWYETLAGTIALVTFKTMLKSIPPTDPVLLLATAERTKEQFTDSPGLLSDFFGYSHNSRVEIAPPARPARFAFFLKALDLIKLPCSMFPDPQKREKRILEALPPAPKIEPAPPTKAEIKALKKKDHQFLNALKIQLQPIMDQINRKYKKFRQPVIPQAQIDYLFAETDPNYVRPDIGSSENRPFEIVKDKNSVDVLRDTVTGKTFYNLETTTIEERLSNGYYARPKDFLFDIKALAKDAKNIGDKERTLKANELLSNVEVDIASIENSTAAMVDWEALYQRQIQRTKEKAEKERQRKAVATNLALDRIQSDIGGGNESDSQGPVTLGVQVPEDNTTTARFQLRSPEPVADAHALSNGDSAKDADVEMSGTGEETQSPSQAMGPPPFKSPGPTQPSQRSALTSLPPGVPPSAVANDASTTKTSDLSSKQGLSNWGTPQTNGSLRGGEDPHLPDTCPRDSPNQRWLHSQPDLISGASSLAQPTVSSSQLQSSGEAKPNNPLPSQPKELVPLVAQLQDEVADQTDGFAVEQLEQLNREMMDRVWQTRDEWNRLSVYYSVKGVFDTTLAAMDSMQQAPLGSP